MIKRTFAAAIIIFLLACLGVAQVAHDISVVNIAVPVRVFAGSHFVDSLKLEDFEILEDGRPQTALAAYLIRDREISRREGPLKELIPATLRHFVLIFQMTEYLPEIGTAIAAFFERVFRSGDSADFVTPHKTYRLVGARMEQDTLKRVKQEITSKVRQDILVDSGVYDSIVRELINDLESSTGAGNESDREIGGIDARIESLAQGLQKLQELQAIDPKKMDAFAGELRLRPGAKHVFLFFQRQRIPKFSIKAMSEVLSRASPATVLKVQELMSPIGFVTPLDRQAIARAFADSSIDVHFLYVTRNRKDVSLDGSRLDSLEDVSMGERTGDVYEAFREIAAATGGTTDASSNPVELMKRADEASRQYYLLYYQPRDYKPDGRFHVISVQVRGTRYKVLHRAGYLAQGRLVAVAGPIPVEPLTEGFSTEDIEIVSASPKGPAPADSVLRSVAAYCRRLEHAVLDFACRERIQERLSGALQAKAPILMDVGPAERGRMVWRGGGQMNREWIYDYLLLRDRGTFRESRVLLKEDGRDKHVKDAALGTARFQHSSVVLGPIGLLGEEAQKIHSYQVVKEFDLEGEPALILDVRPGAESASSLYGKAWIRIRDGAVLKIEWEPASISNYRKIVELADALGARPKILFASEYAFEKNGLRFPSAYSVIESYTGVGIGRLILSETEVHYRDYKFFQVQTTVEY